MRRVAFALVLLASFGPALVRAEGPNAPPPPATLAPPPPAPLEPPPLYSPPAYDANPSQVAAPPAPPPPLGQQGVIRLHLMGPNGLVLKRDSGPPVMVYDEKGARMISGAVCAAPCDVVVDARSGTSFVFGGGDGVPDSSSFDFSLHSGELQARVEPGSKPLRLGAVLLGGAALGAGYLGFVFVTSASGAGSSSDRNFQTQVGLVGLGIAGAMAVGAGLLFLLSRTRYELADAAPASGSH
ncbi:MAG: hypothetical protein JST54_31270 [Deltaproteobacteria bacterium]|nr:hypothetical protein [Deltaproteobacteria bacterium]